MNFVDNPEQIAGLPYTPKDGDDYEYLIITELGTLPQTAWQPFIDFNLSRGLRTKIITTGYIFNNVTGDDNAEKVRNYIKEEYAAHKIVYVMLGGDVEVVPHREFEAHFYDHADLQLKYMHTRNIACDFYFCGLDNTWKSPTGTYTDDHDSWSWTWGCPGFCDFLPDVFASRFPVSDQTELANIINKTIGYSNTPVEDGVKNILLTGGFLWESGGASVWGGDHCEELINTCDKYFGHTTYGWPETIGAEEYKCTITKLYDDKPQTKTWGAQDCIQKVNDSKCSWFIYYGHGNTNNNARISSGAVTNSQFYNSDGSQGNYFIILTAACYPGQYNNTSYDCINEYFTVKISNGAVAAIGDAQSGLLDDNTTDGFQHRTYRYNVDALYHPDRRIHHLDALYGYGIGRCAPLMVGSSIYGSHYNGGMRFTIYSGDLLGDPALSVWTKKPVTYSDLPSHTAAVDEFSMTGIPPYTWVALANTDNDSIITTQLTGFSHSADSCIFNVSDSNCVINDEPYKTYAQSHTTVKVILKAHNCYSYSKTVNITNTSISNTIDITPSLTSITASGNRFRINYNLPGSEFVNISLYNPKGALIKTLINGKQGHGPQTVYLDKDIQGKGIYYCRFNAGTTQCVRKLLVVE